MSNKLSLRPLRSAGIVTSGLLLSGLVWATGSTPNAPATPEVQPMSPMAQTAVPTEPAYQSYVYYGDRYRDPFVPLNSDVRSDSLDRAPAVASLSLKGIIQDSRGRMALLTGGVNSYILRDGRLYDGRNRMVKGISGVIKTDSVIVIGSDRTVKELRAKPAL